MKIRRPEIFFSLLCLVGGFAWIFISTFMFDKVGVSSEQLLKLNVYTDVVFVLLVSAIIYLGIHFYRKRFLASEATYKELFNTSPLPMWIFDIDSSKFLLANKAMIEKYGYTKKEVLSMSPIEIRPKEEIPRFLSDIEKRKEGVQDVGIWTHKKKNGELFTAQVRVKKINYDGKICFLVIADDISDIVEKDKEINRLSLVAKHTLNGIIITGKDRKIEWVNHSFIKMTGYGFDEVIGRVPTELLHGEETDKKVEADMAASIAKGSNYSGEVLNYKKDGSTMWVQTTVSPVEIDGKAEKYVAIFLDITDRKKQEELIRQQNDRLKEIAFASSHLIRAPLANILGLTELLDENKEAFTEKEIIGHLKYSAKKLDEAITDMVKQSVHSSNSSNNSAA